jgi:hypothetical protein
MTVKELIKALSNHDPNAEVFVYSQTDEGGDKATEVLSNQGAVEALYFKGDAPWRNDDDNFVVIS